MSIDRIFGWGATIAVTAVVAVALYLIGTPADQRLARADEQRVADLLMLSQNVQWHYDATRSLPSTLEELVFGQSLTGQPRDPTSDQPYPYEVTGDTAFRLCATFDTARPADALPQGEFWQHPAGAHCFELRVRERSGPLAPARISR